MWVVELQALCILHLDSCRSMLSENFVVFLALFRARLCWLCSNTICSFFLVPENDALDFQPDSQALQSILSNTGISFNQMSAQNTGRVTVAGGRLTPYRRARQSFREVG